MKVPLSWLLEYIDVNLSPQELARTLTMLGLEVEAVEKAMPAFDNVVVGKVLSVEKHPNADNLQVAQVTDGREVYQVVCGDPRCRAGLKTAFCRLGAKLPGDFEIKKVKIRGVESMGMLASEKELQISDKDDGIMEFPEGMEEGFDLKQIFGEIIFEIALTPNLGHCSCMLGVARELSAALKMPYHTPEITVKEVTKNCASVATIQVQEKNLCLRYSAGVIEGVQVGPSPVWLQQKLLRAGLRPVNNVVDVTNFVLLECGQPLHAFDLDQIQGGQVVVRTAKDGEMLLTLDGKHRTLHEGQLIIADKEKPLALAGIMGGTSSEVTEKTTRLLIESANFSGSSVRRTSKQQGLMTDASKRFERGADPQSTLFALKRAEQLIAQIAGGNILSTPFDIKEKEFFPKVITLRVKRVNELLGIMLSPGEVENVFQRLGFASNWVSQEVLAVTVPTYRTDITIEVDLIEEVARIYGYDNLPKKIAKYQTSTIESAPIFLYERRTRSRLVAEGLQEFLTCDLISPEQIKMVQNEAVSDASIVRVLNPTSIEQSCLRPSLLPGLLSVVKNNFDQQTRDIVGFEIGRVHLKQEKDFKEQSVVAIILTGNVRPHHWQEKSEEVNFFDLKGIVENVLEGLYIKNYEFHSSELHTFHPGRQAKIVVDGVTVGSIGEVHPSTTSQIDIHTRVYYAEVSLHDLLQLQKGPSKMESLAKYPASQRDWTITMVSETPVENVLTEVKKLNSSLLEEVQFRYVFVSDRLGSDRKNVTFRFVYRDKSKTIEQEEVDKEHLRITTETLKHLGKAVI